MFGRQFKDNAHSCRILPEAAGATDAMAEALWRVVDNIVDSIDDTLSTSDAEALAAPTEKIHRLRELHASCLPQERQLRFAHLALLTEHHLLAERLLELRRYCALRLQDASLPREEQSFLVSLESLTASLDSRPSNRDADIAR